MAKRHARFELRIQTQLLLLFICTCCCLSGCQSIYYPINSIPAELVPPEFLREPQASKVPIDYALLRHVKPEYYILDADDILGVFVEEVLGNRDEAPPVHFPDPTSDLAPGMGFPIPVRDDGTISLPLIDPLPVRGLTISQVEELIEKRYRELDILTDPKVIVTLLRKRTYRVFVIRQDNTNSQDPRSQVASRSTGVFDRSDYSSRGFVLQMNAYENDILNALTQTGGLPGVNAKPEVTILRGANTGVESRFRQLQEMYREGDPNPFGPEPLDGESILTIPMRIYPDETPNLRPEDVILQNGDIVMVETRDSEVYYTTGELGPGERPLPRDYDLDVFGAVAIAGRAVGVNESRGGGLLGVVGTFPPTRLIVLRKLPGNRQLAIKVDLAEAVNDPRGRILVAPGDTLLLRYKPVEEVFNFGLATFFTFGIQRLFRGN